MNKLFLSTEKIAQTFGMLDGLIKGICADEKIKPSELEALKAWIAQHSYLQNRQPFNEILGLIKEALSDNILTEEELGDIQYVCGNILKNYDSGRIGELLGMVGGIAADYELHEKEWTVLKEWLVNNRSLRGSWPYDEIECLTTKHRTLDKLTKQENEIILAYFNDFCRFNGNQSLTHPLNELGVAITGICAVCPEIEIEEKVFCLTGESRKYLRKEVADKIHAFGGFYRNTLSGLTDYLVVCTQGSPMWIYSCYGRKVENAIAMRKSGHRIQIVHENDLWDYFEDAA